jgi:hypothetical protein
MLGGPTGAEVVGSASTAGLPQARHKLPGQSVAHVLEAQRGLMVWAGVSRGVVGRHDRVVVGGPSEPLPAGASVTCNHGHNVLLR